MTEGLSSEPEYEVSVRKAYLFSMGVCLGVEEQKSRETAEALLERFEDREGLWEAIKGREYRDLPDDLKEKVERIGQRFLTDTAHGPKKFVVGGMMLALINENIENGFFKNMHSMISYWTDDGRMGRKFQELVATEIG